MIYLPVGDLLEICPAQHNLIELGGLTKRSHKECDLLEVPFAVVAVRFVAALHIDEQYFLYSSKKSVTSYRLLSILNTHFLFFDSSEYESLYQLTGMYGVHPSFHGLHTD